jgi:hypothetical protein
MFERFSLPARRAVLSAACHAQTLGHGSVGPEHILLGVLAGADANTPGADPTTARLLVGTWLTYPEAVRRVREGVSETVRRGGLDSTDVAALAELGIDVDAIVDRAEESFGPGALVPNRAGRRRGRARRGRSNRGPGSAGPSAVGAAAGRIGWRVRRAVLRGPLRVPRVRGRHRAAVPFRADAKRLLAGALVQARDLGHRSIGTEHLVLAILASGHGPAYDLLQLAGLDYLTVRQAIVTGLRRAS